MLIAGVGIVAELPHPSDDAGRSLFALHDRLSPVVTAGILPPAARIRKCRLGRPFRAVRNRVSMGKPREVQQRGNSMAGKDLVLSIDQGTTSTRAIVFST